MVQSLDATGTTPLPDTAPDANSDDRSLPQGVLPLWAVFGVSLGILAPASTLALAIGVIMAQVGALSWVTWAVTSVLVLGFAGGISWLAKRFTTTGGVYGLTTRAAGRGPGFFVMFAHLASSLVSGPACVLGAAIYLDAWLRKLGVPYNPWILAGCSAAIAVAVTALSLREVKLSAKLLLLIEFCTVLVIVALMIVILFRVPGGPIDSRQFDFSGFSITAVLAVAGFSVFSMAGFDHAVTLGREARNPKKAISLAVIGSVSACGLLYLVGTYVIVLGFRDMPLDEALNAPLDALADHYGVGWLAHLIDPGVAISFFGSTLGIMAGTSRTVYTMSRDGMLPKVLSGVDPVHKTPRNAVLGIGALYVVVAVLGALLARATTTYGLLGTFAGYMLVATYGATVLAAGWYAMKTRTIGLGIAAATVLAAFGSAVIYWNSFNPFPQGAKFWVAIIFFVSIVAIVGGYAYLKARRPEIIRRVGETDRQTDADVNAAAETEVDLAG
ncbi:APC family permease [Gordonia neofelifaecis]|uniref:Amino acid transporter, permease component n=1 Tax=Gordonia neofelifaecis NRRL B-59395 TaxID=644548 RepID=F1YIT1_9ACTN|nr:APC family permease [Gordonia neofelifaecis]EGD55469.1 amino acid transporter, permease component [Gordonia neofelifaecis NRRL B-59395]